MAARSAASCLRGGLRGRRFISTPAVSRLTSEEVIQMRNDLFTKEKERQLSLYPRIEKIEVKYTGKSHPGSVFVMNKALSTPYNCAMHLSEWHCKKSVLALVDGEVWDMYRPLTKSCEIQFLTFKDEDPEEVNKAYWRSCAMIMACVLKRAFKDEYSVNLIKAPEVPVISGAFCYDVILDNRLNDWKPTNDNFRSLTRDAGKLIHKDLPFETLHVEAKVAREMFQHNRRSFGPFPSILFLDPWEKSSVPPCPLPFLRKLQRAMRWPLSLLFSELDKPKVLSCSSWNITSRPFTSFVGLLWTLSRTLTSFLNYGA
ncbi:large ribosomal subunit protein mL39 isoform 2-T2 [Alca torda]